MSRPADLGDLKSVEWDRLQELADRFEKVCLEAGPKLDLVDLASFLPPQGDPLHIVALNELIKTDLEIRWRRGQTIPVERYLDRFPELGSAGTLSPELIYEEYCVRQQHGDKPDLASYKVRFPEQFAEVQRLAHEQPIQTVTNLSPAPTVISPPPAPPQAAVSASPAGELMPFGGGYRKIKRIGAGSFGEVWRAEAPGGIAAAIKVINRPIETDEAQRELQALERIKNLSHPFLLQTTSFWPLEDRLYIAMELADGSLRDRLKQCRGNDPPGIPLPELLRYFRESAEALDYLHQEHVQHRDIKPENILIHKKHAKVADFGLARMLESQRMVSASSSGTPAYMAPEVWRGKVSPHSDQYSLAATYAELRLDRSLFASRDMLEIMLSHVERQPDLDPLPAAEQAVVLKALAKDPDQRYGSCMEFVDALEVALASELRRTAPNLSAVDVGQTPPSRQFSGVDTALATLIPGQLQPTNLSQPGFSQTAPMAPGQVSAEWKTAAPQRRSQIPLLVLLIVLVALAGFLGWRILNPPTEPPRPFELDRASLTLKAGEASTVNIPVKRNSYQGPIRVTFDDVPDNVEPRAALVEAGEKSVKVTIAALPDAPIKSHLIKVVAKASEEESTASSTLELVVQQPAYTLPEGWSKVPDAGTDTDKDGKIYYKQINVLRADIPVKFILVPNRGTPDDSHGNLAPRTFYVMEHKVWVGLFKAFTEERTKTGKPLKGKIWQEQAINKNDRYPVMGVYVDDAHEFALWFGGLLPSVEEWDKACGSFVEKKTSLGPYQGPIVALNREEPQTIDATTDDVSSPYGVRDTAGNGWEWTRDLFFDEQGRHIPAKDPKGAFVTLRGCSFLHEGKDMPRSPLSYKKLEEWQNSPNSQVAHEYSGTVPDIQHRRDIGFRVVIEPVR